MHSRLPEDLAGLLLPRACRAETNQRLAFLCCYCIMYSFRIIHFYLSKFNAYSMLLAIAIPIYLLFVIITCNDTIHYYNKYLPLKRLQSDVHIDLA